MPGPGGGSSGGGFGGGSFGGGGGFSGGGGFGGGSFGGNHGGSFGGNNNGGHFGGHHGGHFGGHHHHGPHHHGPHFHGPFFGGGWGWGRRRYRTGGCGTGLIIALFVIFAAVCMFAPNHTTVYFDEEPVSAELEGIVQYEESTMQEFADTNYKYHFGDYDNYENNILLVFLKNEACDGYYTIAWVGDNIRYEINEMFGEYTEYGDALRNYVNQNYYAYSLDTDLAAVIKEMYASITSLGFDSSFNSPVADYEMPPSKLDNSTALEMNEELVNGALADFTAQTGIPCVIVVDSAERVFGGDESELPPASVEYDEEWISAEEVTLSDGENAVTGGANYPTTDRVSGGISYVLIIAVVLIALVGVALAIRLKKGNKFTEEADEEKGKGTAVGKDEKPPWEL